MIKSEWKSLLHNKVLVVVVIAILAIPTIYTTLFLGSMWDPYGQLDNLPVAVVNNDREVTYNDQSLNVGENLVDNLRENNSLKFDFVDTSAASAGLESGKYYMVITIPDNFSKNAATLLDDQPQKMELKYETNPGTNYIAMKMSESALEKIKTSVANEVTRTYAETMFNQISEVGDGMQEAADGSGLIVNGFAEVAKGNTEITDNLKVLSDSTLTFKEGSDELSIGLKTYTNGVSEVDKGVSMLSGGVNKLSASASDGADKLSGGASSLSDGVNEYTGGVNQAYKGAALLNSKSGALKAGISNLSGGLNELNSGSSQMLTGMKEMSKQLSNTMPAADDVKALSAGLDSYKNGIKQLSQGVENAEIPDLSAVQASAEKLAYSLSAAGNDAKQIQNALIGLASLDLDALGLTDEQKAAVNAAIEDAVGTVTPSLQDLGSQLNSAASAADDISDALSGAGELVGNLSELKAGISRLNDNADIVLGGSKTAINGMYSGLTTVKSTLDGQLIPGMTLINGGVNEAKNGVDGELTDGVDAYTDGVGQVSAGLATLDENSKALTSGAKALDSGIGELSIGLNGGVKQLKDGAETLGNGTSKLIANNDKLLSGASQLSDGALKISDGAGKLAVGSATLGNGIGELSDGGKTLNNSLLDGAEQVKEVSAGDDTLDMFAAPVEAEETKITTVENNGHAMAAYMMSVALWVGCLAFCIMYPLTSYKGRLKSGMSWWISKATVVYPLAVLMAFVMVGMLQLINGFEPAQLGKTLLMASAASIAFMSIMYFFNVWLGKVGSFIMLIFMVLQLAGSAGTYPVELSGGFVANIHKWLPFSYTVDGFRKTIAGAGSITSEIAVLLIIAVIFTLLTVWMFQIRSRLIKKGKHSVYEFIEKSGLA